MTTDPRTSRKTPGASSLYRVAIVGAGSLLGKEVAEVLEERKFPSVDLKLLDDDESLGQLEAVGDEMTFIQEVRGEQFEHIDFTFFASDPVTTRANWASARDAGSAIVDLSSALEDEPGARIRSPWVERELGQDRQLELQPGPAVAAHPAAVVLALLAVRARKAAEVRSLVASVFEPVSQHGQKGVDELHEQTVNLLSFQELPQKVFDTQVAFNLVRRYGEKAAAPALETVERRVLKHYEQIAGKDAPAPALALLQAPIFHSHSFVVYLEMKEPVALGDLAQALNGDSLVVTRLAEDSPTNVRAAGQGDVLISLTRDPNHEKGIWIWAAADNLRIAARTAVECAESMSSSRPKGSIQ